MQVGIVALAIIICSLLILSATFNLNSIKATCKPSSETIRNSTKVSVPEIVVKPELPIIEEAASEPELLEASSLESVEHSEPVLVEAHETKVTEQIESEESLDEAEPWMAKDTQYESTLESMFRIVPDAEPEPAMIEEPDPEVIEETEVEATEETDTEFFSVVEAGEVPEAFEWEVLEESQQPIIEESTSVAAKEVASEPEILDQSGLDISERSESGLAEARETEVTEEIESEESLDEIEPWLAEDTPYEPVAESVFEVSCRPRSPSLK